MLCDYWFACFLWCNGPWWMCGIKRKKILSTCMGSYIHYSKTSNNRPSEKWTTSLQWTDQLPLIDFTIELISEAVDAAWLGFTDLWPESGIDHPFSPHSGILDFQWGVLYLPLHQSTSMAGYTCRVHSRASWATMGHQQLSHAWSGSTGSKMTAWH